MKGILKYTSAKNVPKIKKKDQLGGDIREIFALFLEYTKGPIILINNTNRIQTPFLSQVPFTQRHTNKVIDTSKKEWVASAQRL